MPPNIQFNWIKRFYREKQNKTFGSKVHYYKDGSESQVMKFDFVTGGLELTINTGKTY